MKFGLISELADGCFKSITSTETEVAGDFDGRLKAKKKIFVLKSSVVRRVNADYRCFQQ